jgi:prepilin-type N-terminal cleavage/methylation domain-containing protein
MNKSFTLIEILVVIIVIGVLSAFIIVGMSSISSKANIAKSQAFLNSMDNSMLLGRVSQWKLDESLSATIYDSWGTNNGTLTDTSGACSFSGTLRCPQTVISGCPSGNCLSFDGNDSINIGDKDIFDFNTNNFTLSIWSNASALYADNRLITKWSNGNNGYAFNIYNASGYATFATNDGTSTTTTRGSLKISLNNWYYLVATKNGADGRVFIDGEEVVYSIKNAMVNPSINSIALCVGAEEGGSWFFNGKIDDVRIYSQAIPTSEIQQNYYLGLNKLFNNNGISLNEFNQRLVQLKTNLSKYE